MGKSYSSDLRERIVGRVDEGHSCRAAARHFGVGASTAIRLVGYRKRTGSIASPRQGRPRGTGKLLPYRDYLIAQVEEKPDITMPELAARLEESHGLRVPPSSLSRFLLKHGFTYKKSTDGIGTRTRQNPAGARDLDL